MGIPQPNETTGPRGHGEPTRIRVAKLDVTVYEESAPLLAAMAADIRAAKSRVWLESYIFADDEAGREIIEAIKNRARQGVDARVMVDAVGSAMTSNSLFEGLQEAGAHYHSYRSGWEALGRPNFFKFLNRRNHRKLLIVDDNVAYFGGMNVVDQRDLDTVTDVTARNLPPSAGWRDVHVRIAGPVPARIAEIFERLWDRVHGHRRRWPPWTVDEMLACRNDGLFVFDSRPSLRSRRPTRVFVPLIRKATRSITISMAYFIPIGSVLRELVRARRRGVEIRVIIPGRSDVKLVQWATRHYYHKLLKHGFQLYERQDRMIHSKAMVVDDVWTIIGSCNLDPRSLYTNLEFLAVFRSRGLNKVIKRICAYEIRHSVRVTPRDCARRHWWELLRDRAAWSVRWLL